jgi:hypothetical protein
MAPSVHNRRACHARAWFLLTSVASKGILKVTSIHLCAVFYFSRLIPAANSLLSKIKIMLRACHTLNIGRPSLLATYSREQALMVSSSRGPDSPPVHDTLSRHFFSILRITGPWKPPGATHGASIYCPIFRGRGTLKWNRAGKSTGSAVGSNP